MYRVGPNCGPTLGLYSGFPVKVLGQVLRFGPTLYNFHCWETPIFSRGSGAGRGASSGPRAGGRTARLEGDEPAELAELHLRKVPYNMVSHTTLHTTLRIIRGDKIVRQSLKGRGPLSPGGFTRVGEGARKNTPSKTAMRCASGLFLPVYSHPDRLMNCEGCGGCFFAVLFISSVDVMQNCEGSLSRDKFLVFLASRTLTPACLLYSSKMEVIDLGCE